MLLLFKKKKSVRVILAQRAMQYFSAQKREFNRFHVEEKIVIPAKAPQHSAVGFSVIFALLGEQSRVPTFRPSETLWEASQAVDEGAPYQESVPLLHSSILGFVPELWLWIWAVAPALLPSS